MPPRFSPSLPGSIPFFIRHSFCRTRGPSPQRRFPPQSLSFRVGLCPTGQVLLCVVPAEFARHSLALCENRRSLHFRLEHRQQTTSPICISAACSLYPPGCPPHHITNHPRQGDAWRRKEAASHCPLEDRGFLGLDQSHPRMTAQPVTPRHSLATLF